MLLRTLPKNPLQKFCKIVLNSKVLPKSILDPDNNFNKHLLQEFLALWTYIFGWQMSLRTQPKTPLKEFLKIILNSKVYAKSIFNPDDNSNKQGFFALWAYIFGWQMLLRTQPKTPLQIFCIIILNSKVYAKSILDPDDNSKKPLLQEFLALWAYIFGWQMSLRTQPKTPLKEFLKIILNSKVYAKSIFDPDDNFNDHLLQVFFAFLSLSKSALQRFCKIILSFKVHAKSNFNPDDNLNDHLLQGFFAFIILSVSRGSLRPSSFSAITRNL